MKNGLIVLDEPAVPPDGEVVYLVPAELGDEERAALHEALRESIEQMSRGDLIDADDALAELRAHRSRSA